MHTVRMCRMHGESMCVHRKRCGNERMTEAARKRRDRPCTGHGAHSTILSPLVRIIAYIHIHTFGQPQKPIQSKALCRLDSGTFGLPMDDCRIEST